MSQTIKLRRSATSGSIPTTAQLNLGELAINTYDGKLFLKKSVSGTETIVEVGATNLADSFKLYEYSVTSSTSVFSGADDNSNTLSYNTGSPPYVSVFLNGVLLDWGTDYNATNGTSISLTTAASSGDLIQIEAYKSTVVADTNLQFDDNVKVLFGNDGDLEIFHNGTRSIINDAGTGNLQFQIGGSAIYDVTTDGIVLNNGLDVEASEFIGDLRGAVLFKAQAGENISKGQVVYISGINGNTTTVSLADANDANKMPAFGVAAQTITSGNPIDIYTFGTLSGLDTSSFTVCDELYVSTTAGALTNSAPTGSSAQIQKIAKVTRSDNSAGSIKIMGAGRTNATPNLDEGKIFVGNASNQSVQVDDTIHVDMANSRVGINTTSPSSALDVTGTVTADGVDVTGNVSLADNGKATFGASDDLQIYHDGSNSYISDIGTGNLRIDATNFYVRNSAGTELKIGALDDGSVDLYHDGAKKLATTATGIDVTGNVSLADNGKAKFGASDDLQIYHDGSHSYISDIGTGNLKIKGSNAVQLQSADGENYLFGNANAAVTLYYDGAAKIATASTGVDVTGTVNADGLTVSDGTETTSIPATADRLSFTGASLNYIQSAGALFLQPTGDLVFNGTGAEIMRLKSGKVGIGTTTPLAKFQVEEYAIDTTETSTTATTQVAIHSFAAANFRSARYTIQVTNSTDSTYHLTEILMIHDGTTPQITEYGTIFTGSAEATFDADISSGNVRLLATPATTDSMEFKVVCHNITV